VTRVGILFAACALVCLMSGHGGAPRRTVEATVEPATLAVLSPAGGTVTEVLASAGDTVVKDQPLVRFDTAALLERRAAVASAIESARTLSTIPRAAANLAVDVHPEVIAAEETYARVVAAFEQGRATRPQLDGAAAGRIEARKRVSASLSRSASGIGATLDSLRRLLSEIDRAIADREVRAPAAGIVEVLDLKPGDRIVPGAPAALVRIPGEYTCEFLVPAGSVLQPGATVFLNGHIEARVERVWSRPVPSALREDRSIAEETVAQVGRAILPAAGIPAGRIRVQLP
jgi:multidrug resistance efflux pump